MRLVIEDIELQDDSTDNGGTSYEGETLGEFLDNIEELNLSSINSRLKEIGIKPITLGQVKIIGVE